MNHKNRKWATNEVEFLKEQYTKLGTKECANQLNRSISSICRKAYRLGLHIPSEKRIERILKARGFRPWAKEEELFLKQCLSSLGIQECARQLERSKLSVWRKAQKLDLTPSLEKRNERIQSGYEKRPGQERIARTQLIQELLNLAYLLDRSPRAGEMQDLSKFSTWPFYQEFGSWNRALAAAGLPPSPPAMRSNTVAPRFCEICDTLIEKPHPRQRLCSIECRTQYCSGENNVRWKGGKFPYYGPNWRRQRRRARKQDGYACQFCGATEAELGRQLDVHHVIPFRKFGIERYKEANHLDNLISLCHSCHASLPEDE